MASSEHVFLSVGWAKVTTAPRFITNVSHYQFIQNKIFRTPKFQKDVFFSNFDFHNINSHHIKQNYVTLAIGKEVKLGIIGGY